MKNITESLSIGETDENGCVSVADNVTGGEIYILPSEIIPLFAHLTWRAADWLIWSAKEWVLAQFANR